MFQGLVNEQSNIGFPNDQFILMFVHPIRPTKWHIDFCKFQRMGFVKNANVDVGMIEFSRPSTKEFEQVKPVQFQTNMFYAISESIALYGYPYGHEMLQRDGMVYRWGPVLQQGFISAISPFDNTGKPDELLLDVRIAGGMSGSPVFRPSDGKVIGVVHSTWETTTALALPLDQNTFQKMLRQHNEQRNKLNAL